MPKLVLRKKNEVIKEFIFDKNITIGKAKNNNICIDEQSISEVHCKIEKRDSKYYLSDMNTYFGTFINGKKIEGETELFFNDEINIAMFTLAFRQYIKNKKNLKDTETPEIFSLLGIYGPYKGKKFELVKNEIKIGRKSDFHDIFLEKDNTVSATQGTKIIFSDNKYTLVDKLSKNKPFVNKMKMTDEKNMILNLNDEITIGRSIFRFISDKNFNYGFPRKIGAFSIKLNNYLNLALSIFFILTGLIIFIKNMDKITMLNIKPSSLIPSFNKNFAILPEDIVDVNPQIAYNISTSPCLCDINMDGKIDIVFLTSTGKIYAFDGKTGNSFWTPLQIGVTVNKTPIIEDINKDGRLEILVCSDDSSLYIIDAQLGKILHKIELQGNLSGAISCDINFDGLADAVVTTADKKVYFIYDIFGKSEIKSVELTDETIVPPNILFGKKEVNILVPTLDGIINIINGSTLETRLIDVTSMINQSIGVNIPKNSIVSNLAVADINNDGFSDFVVQTRQYNVVAISGKTFNLLWTPPYQTNEYSEETPDPNQYSAPLLLDLDNDNKLDIVVNFPNGNTVAMSGTTGEVYWIYKTGRTNRLISSPVSTDLDRDGIADILFGNEDGCIYALQGSKLSKLLYKIKVSDYPIVSSIATGDVNSDGYLDIVFSNMKNELSLWNTEIKVFKNQIFWPMFRGDAYNSGYIKQTKASDFTFQIINGLCLIVIVIIYNLILRKKKQSKLAPVIFIK